MIYVTARRCTPDYVKLLKRHARYLEVRKQIPRALGDKLRVYCRVKTKKGKRSNAMRLAFRFPCLQYNMPRQFLDQVPMIRMLTATSAYFPACRTERLSFRVEAK